MKHLGIIIAIVFIGFSSLNFGQIPLYGIEGWGVNTIGGQGGLVIHVTNLNASGAGSLKDALSQTGGRIIVFDVGGTINLGGQSLSIKQPNVTIAGQTAPSPGINIINGSISIQSHDVVLQHIRMRVGAAGQSIGWDKDGISTYSSSNVIIDHCSISWAVDENCSASGPRFDGITPDEWRANTSHDITISNCIIAEGLSNATHPKGEHSKGSLIHDNVTNIAIIKNLYISNKDRNPLFKGGARGVITNNYIHNPGNAAIKFGLVDSEWTGYEWQEAQMTIIGNVLQYGPDTSNIPLVKAGNGPCSIYLQDNQAKNVSGENVFIYSGNSANLINTKPTWYNNISILNSQKIKNYLVNQAGARAWNRDFVDSRLVNEVNQGLGQIIDFETEVGSFPNLPSNTSTFDEHAWNLDYMIEKTDLVLIETDKDNYYTNEPITVNINADAFTENIELLDLVVNGKSIGTLTESPFIWSFSEESIGDGTIQVIIKETNGRLSISETKTVSITEPLSIIDDKENNIEVNIYPNPFNDFVSVSFSKTLLKQVELELKDLLGKVLIKKTFPLSPENKQNYQINTSNLNSGVYCLSIKTKNNTIENRIMVLSR